jgi:hypothetical protein
LGKKFAKEGDAFLDELSTGELILQTLNKFQMFAAHPLPMFTIDREKANGFAVAKSSQNLFHIERAAREHLGLLDKGSISYQYFHGDETQRKLVCD